MVVVVVVSRNGIRDAMKHPSKYAPFLFSPSRGTQPHGAVFLIATTVLVVLSCCWAELSLASCKLSSIFGSIDSELYS